jgi:hypothetical protein
VLPAAELLRNEFWQLGIDLSSIETTAIEAIDRNIDIIDLPEWLPERYRLTGG